MRTEDGYIWIIPLARGDPFPLELDVSVAGKPDPLYPSPDCQKLAFVVERSDENKDLYVVPVSLKDGRTIGSAVMVFSGWDPKHSYDSAFSWSPDGTKIALSHEENIWMASAEGGEPAQVTVGKHPEYRMDPGWSPDGKMICYKIYHSEKEEILRVVPASGSEDTIISDIPLVKNPDKWSADSKDFVSFSEGVISAISIADGKTRQILDLKEDLRELSIDMARSFCWSPDRQKLAFIGWREAEKSHRHHIFTVPAEGGEFTELAADDPGIKFYLHWSPDGKWISYQSDGFVKTRPEGVIWETDVSELLSVAEKEQER